MTIIVYLFNPLTLLVQYISNKGLRSLRGLRTQVVSGGGGIRFLNMLLGPAFYFTRYIDEKIFTDI